MRIITFGTGAGRPTLHRAPSAAGLEYEGNTFLFDCGEGTQVQLMKSAFKWGKLTAILITHLHGDHVNGLPGLLGTLGLSGREAPLKVFGPIGLKKLIQTHQECQSMGIQYPLELIEITQAGTLLETPNYFIKTLPLHHVIPCWGYAFHEKDLPGRFDREKAVQDGIPEGPLWGQLVQGQDIELENGQKFYAQDYVGPRRPGRSMAYCLDTRPCKNAISLAQGVDILLHEATFLGSEDHNCHLWGHSTSADAARTALQAQVSRLILTHVSQRYGEAKELEKEAQAIFPKAQIAHDLAEFFIEKKEA